MSSQQDRHSDLLLQCVESLSSWKQLINEYLPPEALLQEEKKLREITKDICKIVHENKKVLEALQETNDDLNNSENIKDVDEIFKNKLKDLDTPLNVAQHEIWREVFGENYVQEITNTTQSHPNQSLEFEMIDDSISCCSVFTPPIDPISKTVIKSPYRNSICGHMYEYEMILQYIKKMKGKSKCPYVGCMNSKLSAQGLVKDDEMKRKIEEYLLNHQDDDD